MRFANRLFFLLCLLLSTHQLEAQLQATFVDNPAMDASRYPLLSVRVKATLNKAPFVLGQNNVLLREDIQISHPLSVSAPVNGVQTIEWYTRSRDMTGGNATVVFFEKNFTTSLTTDTASGLPQDGRVPQIRINNGNYKQLQVASFGLVSKDSSKTLGFLCIPTSGRIDADGGERVRVDSIKTETEFFQPAWRGGPGAWALPGRLSSPLDYVFTVTFRPTENKYYHDVLTIYYEGGAVERMALSGNTFDLPIRTILNLTTPNGREVLAPCQETPVAWTGASAGSTTIVEYSVDEGKNWVEIQRTKDTSFIWRVPDTPSDNVELRVRAELSNLTDNLLVTPNTSSCDRIAFRPDNQILLAAYRNSEAYEWDVNTNAQTKKYTLRADGQLNASTQAFGADYIDASKFFIVYRSTVASAKSDTIAFFTSGTSSPSSVKALDESTRYRAAMLDSTRSTIVLVPQLGTILRLISAQDASLIRDIPFSQPISAVSLGKTQAVVALMDATIQIFTLPDWTLLKTVTMSGMPLIDQVLVLPDNQRIAVGCHVSTSTLNEGAFSDGYMIDIATSLVIRTQRKSSSSPVCVSANATSRYVLFGYIAQPQAPLWDISPNQVYGTIVSHAGALNQLGFSPNGQLLASCANAADNLRLKQFIYPEIDYTDDLLRIVRPSMTAVDAQIDSTYAYTSRDSVLTLNLCNKGIVPLIVSSNSLDLASNFRFLNYVLPDTIQPGACARIPMSFVPQDTGMLKDVVRLKNCGQSYALPVRAYSIPRKLGIPDTLDFGDVCPDVDVEKEFVIMTNSDPVPIIVNRAFLENETDTWYTVVSKVKNDTVQAKSSYTIRIRFRPKKIGEQYKTLLLFYGNQSNQYAHIVLRGRGAGSQVDILPSVVTFLRNVPQRTVVLRNPNANPVLISSLNIKPSNAFSLDAVNVPYTLPAGDSLVLTVHWNDTTITDGSIDALIAPCSAPLSILIRRYEGFSELKLPSVKADPIGDAEIPIHLRVTENFAYGAERSLNAEFSVNPRIFLPQSINSWLGKAEITRNEIVNDQRIVGFSIRADFPLMDTIVAVIKGPAGLAETDRSPLHFIPQSQFFGPNVTTATTDGQIQLINLCGDRRIVQSGTLVITAVQPTPANATATVAIASSQDADVDCDVFSPSGVRIQSQRLHISAGTTTQSIDCSSLMTGTYTLVVHNGIYSTRALLLIAR